MKELYSFGFSDVTLKQMYELNPSLKNISEEEVIDLIRLFNSIGCNKEQIYNIFSINSFVFNRSIEELVSLFGYLNSIGFKTLSILFDSNPYILNLDINDIKLYIDKRVSKGEKKEDLILLLDEDPLLFN